MVRITVINMAKQLNNKKVLGVEEKVEVPKKPEIGKLAIDYPHEYLNSMAKKINEIIDYLHAL